MIKDLRERLTNRRPLTKPLEGIQSEYGINTDYLETILEYWANEYDFKKRAELLNEFDHYKTRIQGLDLHFIRSKPKDAKGKQVLPLLMLHGWPSSSKEFVKVIPLLNAPREGFDFVFDVVAADLPGFGFSEVRPCLVILQDNTENVLYCLNSEYRIGCYKKLHCKPKEGLTSLFNFSKFQVFWWLQLFY